MSAETVLVNAAFGDDPGRWPLPAATTPDQLWLRAVVAGGQGRYASALADLAGVCRLQRVGPVVSLAHSTRASFLRQLGWHARARGWDGRASALAGADLEAHADALIGLAADALGVGRFAASAAALHRAAAVLTESVPARLPVRLAWVSAELAMARGDGAAAVGHAQTRRRLGWRARLGSAHPQIGRHPGRGVVQCRRTRVVAPRRRPRPGHLSNDCGTVPLRWALACLLADIGSATRSAAQVAAIRDECADTVRRRGGVWSVR